MLVPIALAVPVFKISIKSTGYRFDKIFKGLGTIPIVTEYPKNCYVGTGLVTVHPPLATVRYPFYQLFMSSQKNRL